MSARRARQECGLLADARHVNIFDSFLSRVTPAARPVSSFAFLWHPFRFLAVFVLGATLAVVMFINARRADCDGTEF